MVKKSFMSMKWLLMAVLATGLANHAKDTGLAECVHDDVAMMQAKFRHLEEAGMLGKLVTEIRHVVQEEVHNEITQLRNDAARHVSDEVRKEVFTQTRQLQLKDMLLHNITHGAQVNVMANEGMTKHVEDLVTSRSTPPSKEDLERDLDKCYGDESNRLKRQAVVKGITGALSGASSAFAFSKKRGRKSGKQPPAPPPPPPPPPPPVVKKFPRILVEVKTKRFFGVITAGIAGGLALVDSFAGAASDHQNAAAENCEQKGFQMMLDQFDQLQDSVGNVQDSVNIVIDNLEAATVKIDAVAGRTEHTIGLVHELQTSLNVHAKQTKQAFDIVMEQERSTQRQMHWMETRLDERMQGIQAVTVSISIKLGEFSKVLTDLKATVVDEGYQLKAIAFRSWIGDVGLAYDDALQFLSNMLGHRFSIIDLDASSQGNLLAWGRRDRQEEEAFRVGLQATFSRARDGLSKAATVLQETDFLTVHFKEAVKVATYEFLNKGGDNICEEVVSNSTNLINDVKMALEHDELLDVIFNAFYRTLELQQFKQRVKGESEYHSSELSTAIEDTVEALKRLRTMLTSVQRSRDVMHEHLPTLLSARCPINVDCQRAIALQGLLGAELAVRLDATRFAIDPMGRHQSNVTTYACTTRPRMKLGHYPAMVDELCDQWSSDSWKAGRSCIYHLALDAHIHFPRPYPTQQQITMRCPVGYQHNGGGGRVLVIEYFQSQGYIDEFTINYTAGWRVSGGSTLTPSDFMCELAELDTLQTKKISVSEAQVLIGGQQQPITPTTSLLVQKLDNFTAGLEKVKILIRANAWVMANQTNKTCIETCQDYGLMCNPRANSKEVDSFEKVNELFAQWNSDPPCTRAGNSASSHAPAQLANGTCVWSENNVTAPCHDNQASMQRMCKCGMGSIVSGYTCEYKSNYMGETSCLSCPIENVATLSDCATKCDTQPGCSLFVYNKYKACYLKTDFSIIEYDPAHGTTSCVKAPAVQ